MSAHIHMCRFVLSRPICVHKWLFAKVNRLSSYIDYLQYCLFSCFFNLLYWKGRFPWLWWGNASKYTLIYILYIFLCYKYRFSSVYSLYLCIYWKSRVLYRVYSHYVYAMYHVNLLNRFETTYICRCLQAYFVLKSIIPTV